MDVTLICLPFAGGSKYSLRYLAGLLPANLTCVFCEYAGHGSRSGEPLPGSLQEIQEDLYNAVAHMLDKPYAIFGHSMGAKLAYLLTRKIKDEGRKLPLHVFVSGTEAPAATHKRERRHHLGKAEFLQSVKILGGLPDEVLADADMLDFFEPLLRADFRLVETYAHEVRTPLEVPFSVMIGTEEKIAEEDIHQWQDETSLPLMVDRFPGNHFFIYKQGESMAKLIAERLTSNAPSRGRMLL